MPATSPPSPNPPATAEKGHRGGRILGIDVARALAIVGMVMVHVGPTGARAEGPAGRIYALSHGRASILFVLLAGLGVSLLAGDRSPSRLRRTWTQLVWRAVVLLPLGLALQLLDHGVLVILQYYALYFLLAGAVVGLGDRLLLGSAAVMAVVGPVLHLAAWHRWPEAVDRSDPTAWGDAPLEVARQLLLTGSYPVATWAVPLLVGVWLGRRPLIDPRVHRWLVGIGVLLAVAGRGAAAALEGAVALPATQPSWAQLALDSPHSQMPLWLIGSSGAAMAVLGLCLRLGDRLPSASWPLAAMGQLAFTVYVGHLLVLHAWPDLLVSDEVVPAAASVLLFTAVVVVVSVLWRRWLPRGPLEALLRLPRAVLGEEGARTRDGESIR